MVHPQVVDREDSPKIC